MEVQYKYYDLLISLCIENLWNAIYTIAKERCSGCETKHPSKLKHSCFMDSKEMKLIMNFQLVYMNLNIQEIFRSMLRDHRCDRTEIKSLWKIMKTYCYTDLWKSKLYSTMEKSARLSHY